MRDAGMPHRHGGWQPIGSSSELPRVSTSTSDQYEYPVPQGVLQACFSLLAVRSIVEQNFSAALRGLGSVWPIVCGRRPGPESDGSGRPAPSPGGKTGSPILIHSYPPTHSSALLS